jgi:ClpP class serine protease
MKHPKILAQIENIRWAITPEALESIWDIVSQDMTSDTLDVYERFHRASEADRLAITSSLGEPTLDNGISYQKDGLGTIRIEGPIVPRASSFDAMSGITSIDALMADFKALEANLSIQQIMLLIDSPGGSITGISEFSALVQNSSKPTTAYVYGTAASAAYWIATAADSIVAADMGEVGSIGIVATLRSKKDDKKIEIVSAQSPMKRPDYDTSEGRSGIQGVVNELTDVFVETVAKNRGVDVKKVLEDFGRGGTVAAQRALSVGMIDEIATLESTITKLSGSQVDIEPPFMVAQSTSPAAAGKPRRAGMLKDLLAENPAAAAEFEKALQAARDEGHKQGIAEVNDRVAQAMPYLTSDSYDGSVKKVAGDVIAGEAEARELKSLVAMHDLFAEKTQTLAAQLNTQATGIVGTTGPATDGAVDFGKELAEDNKIRKELGLKPLTMEV